MSSCSCSGPPSRRRRHGGWRRSTIPTCSSPRRARFRCRCRSRSCLGPANLVAATLAARWRATTERSHARVPIGVTHRGTVEIDLERDGPHVLIGGAAGTGKSELLRTLVVGLAAGLPPGALTFALLDLAGRSTFGACAVAPARRDAPRHLRRAPGRARPAVACGPSCSDATSGRGAASRCRGSSSSSTSRPPSPTSTRNSCRRCWRSRPTANGSAST